MARLAANGGLFAIALFSILVRNPFTLQYAREQVPREFWETPRFIWTNYIITGAWAIAFAVMAAADALNSEYGENSLPNVTAVSGWDTMSAIYAAARELGAGADGAA